MKQTLFMITVSVIALSMYPRFAMANRVAVLPTVYKDANTGVRDANAAADFHGSVLEGVEKAGSESVAREQVLAASREYAVSGMCDYTCLRQVRSELGADEAIQVVVEEDREMASRHIAVSFAIRDDIVQDTSDGYAVVKTWLKGAVALALKESIAPAKSSVAEAPEKSEPAAPAAQVEKEGETTVEMTKEPPRKKLGPAPLVIAGTTTLLLGVATVVLDQLAHQNYKTIQENLKETPEYTSTAFNDDKARMENQQLMTKIFLVATGVGVLTTGVFAIFTDYSKFRKNREKVSAAFSVEKNAGAIILGGSF